jgi:outer membrane lipoprotein-sorting protein
MKSLRISWTVILLFLCNSGFAQSQQDALDVLNKVGETYRSVKTLQGEADVQSEMSTHGMEQKMTAHIVLTTAAPGKFRMETNSGPAHILMIGNGQTLWMYLPDLNKYSKIAVPVGHDSGPNALSAGLPGLGSLPDFTKVADGVKEAQMLPSETLQVDGVPTDCYVISVLHPPSEGAAANAAASSVQPTRETLWVDKARLLVVRFNLHAEISSPGSSAPLEDKSTLTFTKLALDNPVPDDAFVFSPPQGATEMDLTQFMPQKAAPQ